MPLYQLKCPECEFRTSIRVPVEQRDEPRTSHCPKVDREVTLQREFSTPGIKMDGNYSAWGRVWSPGDEADQALDQAIRDSL